MARERDRRAGAEGNRMLAVGGAGLLLFMVLAAAAPRLAPFDPNEQLDPAGGSKRPPLTRLAVVELEDGRYRLADSVERLPEGLAVTRLGRRQVFPAEEVANLTSEGVDETRLYLLGTDRFGRDLLSRILHGGRLSLAIGLASGAVALGIGLLVGSVAALGRAWLDAVLMRSVDALLAVPQLFLLLAVAAYYSTGPATLVLVLGGLAWMGVSRLVRGELLSLEGREFVLAARSAGRGRLGIFWHHLLPNAWSPLLVHMPLLVAQIILVESALSFLGMGVQPPAPSWGNIISEGTPNLLDAWWITAFPGLALAATVISLNLLGDGLRDRMDPHLGS